MLHVNKAEESFSREECGHEIQRAKGFAFMVPQVLVLRMLCSCKDLASLPKEAGWVWDVLREICTECTIKHHNFLFEPSKE